MKMDATELNRNIDIEMLKEELVRNTETISALHSRNHDIATRLITLIHGISVGDIVSTPGGKDDYIIKEIVINQWMCNFTNGKHIPPWVVVNPRIKDGRWDEKREINLYGNWRKKS